MTIISALRKLSMASAGVAFILLGAAFTNAPDAKAAIFSVNDSGSWLTGTNTISNLGFNMVTVPNSPEPTFSSISTLSSPLGDVNFSPNVEKRAIGEGWATWSNDYTGEVYFNGGVTTTTITLPFGIGAFDFYVEPNNFNIFSIAATAKDGTTATLAQIVDGVGGAKYFGFYGTDGDKISSITVTDTSGQAGGFAVGQLRLASAPTSVPEPGSVLDVGAFGALGVSFLLKRSQRKQQKKA